MPIIWKKYDRGIILTNDKPELLPMLEPWADTLYTSLDCKDYIEKEQPKTVVSLIDRIKPYDNEKQNEILITVDGDNFTQQDFIYLQKLAEILDTQSPPPGQFKLGNLTIEKIKVN